MGRSIDLKSDIRKQLQSDDLEAVNKTVSNYPARRVVNVFIAFFCDRNPFVRWRAIEAAGELVSKHAQEDLESARVIMRRFLWMLNDESGGIGWGVPEAMGEILSLSDRLSMEYSRFFLSYIQCGCNNLEHPLLQRGLLWGIARLARKRSPLVSPVLRDIASFLDSGDPYHRALATLVFAYAGTPQWIKSIEVLSVDETVVEIYEERVLKTKTVAECCRFAIETIRAKNADNPVD